MLTDPRTALFFHRIDPLPYSPYVEECLQNLEELGDSPNERKAITMVKLQIIVERIQQSPWHRGKDAMGISPAAMLIVRPLQTQLEHFKKALSPELGDDGQLYDLSLL
jgi:hypothetical protein